MKLLESYPYAISGIVISFNTRELLRECLESFLGECARLPVGVKAEILVVDNDSKDGSPEMVQREFANAGSPVRLIRSAVNLGFGAANNLAMEQAQGRYFVLLNSDAFLHTGSLRLALKHIEASPATGFGGAKLVGRGGELQPSGRSFHTIWNDAITLTGISAKYPRSKILGAPDRTWADPDMAAEVDWVPGAFMIMRREALAKVGTFDPRFFLYYEETDLCRRVKAAGYQVSYWPDVVVTHIGGESGKQLTLADRFKSRVAGAVMAHEVYAALLPQAPRLAGMAGSVAGTGPLHGALATPSQQRRSVTPPARRGVIDDVESNAAGVAGHARRTSKPAHTLVVLSVTP